MNHQSLRPSPSVIGEFYGRRKEILGECLEYQVEDTNTGHFVWSSYYQTDSEAIV